MGALPTLRAATDPGAQGGQYYGPGGFGEQRGHPKVVESSAQSHDEDIQRRLWTRVRRVDRRDVPGLMRSVEEHRRVVAGLITPRPPVGMALAGTLGLVLAEDVVAPLSLPGFDNSAMDGYAVIADDIAGGDVTNSRCCCPSPRTFPRAAPIR